MSLIMRNKSDLDDLLINGQILFTNWELTEDDLTNSFRINNNGVNVIYLEDGNGFVGINKSNPARILDIIGNNMALTSSSGDAQLIVSSPNENAVIILDASTGGGGTDIQKNAVIKFNSIAQTRATIGFDFGDLAFKIEIGNDDTFPNDNFALTTTGLGLGVVAPTVALDVNGEIKATICSTIGTLGYILLDEQSNLDMDNVSFDLTLDLDNQSTDDFAVYKLIYHGHADGLSSGSNTSIRIVFVDLQGDIQVTNGYMSIINGTLSRANSMLLMETAGSTTDRMYAGDFTINLSTIPEECQVIGISANHSRDGTVGETNYVHSSMTNLATIDTRIIGIKMSINNSNNVSANPMHARVYRLL